MHSAQCQVDDELDWSDVFTAPYYDIQHKLLGLADVDVACRRQVQDAIRTLESLRRDFSDFDHEAGLSERYGMSADEISALLGMYDRHLSLLKQNEGANFRASEAALKTCTRLALFLFLTIADWYGSFCGASLSTGSIDLVAHTP